jgi:stage IV sporulation protein FB
VVDGNIDGIKPFDEIKIALAGPFINIAVGVLFVAVWWVYPQTYPYTDLAVETCFSLALVNFIPAYPLDGGRILNAILREKLGSEKALKITKTIGVVLSIVLFACFIATCFYAVNLSLLFFSIFTLVGVFAKKSAGKYVRLFDDYKTEKLKKGMVVKRLAVDKSITVKRLLVMLDPDAINEVCVYDGEKSITVLTQKRITDIAKTGDLYSPVSKYLSIAT